MSEDEEIIYSLCTELQRNKGVSEATYRRAVGQFGEQGVIDAVGIQGYYTLLAMVMNTARTPLSPGRTPALAPFPR
jgi:4-carboxymuconolactone decarboxylase